MTHSALPACLARLHRPQWRLALLGIYLLLLAILLAAAPHAHAAGGAHVIDDSEVEEPGTCHLETWLTRFDGRRGLLNLAPACTREAWPSLEIGGAAQFSRDSADVVTAGPNLKWNLLPAERGLGIALVGAGAWDLGSGRLETAILILPVTLPVTEWLRINFNIGWSYARASERQHAAFYGAQMELDLGAHVSLMAEVFQRDYGLTGAQFGLRWNPGGGPVDLDLLIGRRIDGTSPRAITVGLTFRH